MAAIGHPFRQRVVATLLALVPLGGGAHDLVSGGADGQPLSPTLLPAADEGFVPLDVSFDGRYVLFANRVLPTTVDEADPDCTIYRKDRNTGELITVLTSVDGERYYCYGAKLSADGEVVVAAPASVPTNPDGTIVTDGNGMFARFDFGDIIAVTVRDIAADTTTDIIERLTTLNARDVARVQLGTGMGFTTGLFSGYGELVLAGNASLAIGRRGRVTGFVFQEEFKTFDLTAGIVAEDDLLSGIDFPVPPGSPDAVAQITGASISNSGRFVALSAEVSGPLSSPVAALDPCIIDAPTPLLENCRSTNFFVLDRDTDVTIEIEELRRGFDSIASGGFTIIRPRAAIRPDSLSIGGNVITLLEQPALCSDPNNFGVTLPCSPDGVACVEDECSLKVTRLNITTREIEEQTTQVGQLTEHLYRPPAQISRDSRFILYPRAPINPLGGTFEFPSELSSVPPTDFVCVSRDSIDSGSGLPVSEPCVATDPGPIQPCLLVDPATCGPVFDAPPEFTRLDQPVLWYLRNLNSGAEQLVSVHDSNFFQSNQVRLSGDGGTVAYFTRDPRLREDVLTNNSLDESLLPDECFWPNGPAEPNLRVITNDNTTFFTAPTQYVYEATPVFCPAPSPVIEAQIYADDLFSRGFVPVPVRRASSSFGLLLVPLVLLLLVSASRGSRARSQV